MKNVAISVLISLSIVSGLPKRAEAQWVVTDPGAYAHFVQEFLQLLAMYKELKAIYRDLSDLRDWGELDHEGLAPKEFGRYFERYRTQFSDVYEKMKSVDNLLDQVSRLDEIYMPYHGNWENEDKEEPLEKNLKKQLLISKKQLKHGLIVGAEIKKKFEESQNRTEYLLGRAKQAAGALVAAGIGNQLLGEVCQNLQNLNIQMNEYVQAYSATQLKENSQKGKKRARLEHVMDGWGKPFGVKPLKMKDFEELR